MQALVQPLVQWQADRLCAAAASGDPAALEAAIPTPPAMEVGHGGGSNVGGTVASAVNCRDSQRCLTPLHWTILGASECESGAGDSAGGFGKCAALLLAHGADPNARDSNGSTPLHYAARYNCLAVCQQLLTSRRTRLDSRNRWGRTALMFAAWGDAGSSDRGVAGNAVSNAASNGPSNSSVSIGMGIGVGSNVVSNSVGSNSGNNPSNNMLSSNNLSSNNLSSNNLSGNVANGNCAGSNVVSSNSVGGTGVVISSGSDRAELVKLLLAAGASPDVRDSRSRTALMWAALTGKTELLRLLLAAGADWRRRNQEGRTAGQLAEREGHAEAARMLSAVMEESLKSAQLAAASLPGPDAATKEAVTVEIVAPPLGN